MGDGIWSALSGAMAQQRSLDIVANNVANANTTGFRADRAVFEQTLSQAGVDGPAPESLRYVDVTEIATDHSAGALQQTGGALDFALEGDGWFTVRTSQGERYTRAGSFVTNGEGLLTTHDGHPVLGVQQGNEPPPVIQIPPDTREIRVTAEGRVFADEADVGQLRVVRFDDVPRKEGLTLYTGRNAEVSDAPVRQGFLEMANVNAVAGMNELITVTRSFEAFQKLIETFQALDQRTARDVAG